MKWLATIQSDNPMVPGSSMFTVDCPDGLEGPRNAATMALDLCAASNPLSITVQPLGLGETFEVVKRAPYLRAV